MLQVKQTLKGRISGKSNLNGKLNNAVEYVYPELEDLEVISKDQEQKIKSQSKYGFNEITVKPISASVDEDIQPENIRLGKNILGVDGIFDGIDTSDATATANDILEGKTAYVNKEKLEGTIGKYDGSYEGNADKGFVIMDASYLFYNGARTEHIYELLSLCEGITSANNMFYRCRISTELDVSKLDTSKCTDMYRMFGSMNISKLDLSNFNTSKCTDMGQMFYASNFSEINLSSFDTSNVTNMSEMFYNCKITDLILLDTSKVNSIGGIVNNCGELINLGGFLNLGKAYTQKSNNYSNYKLYLSPCTKLTHDSLMNVINNLYDLNLTYDVANGGTLYTQSLNLGSTNLAKLTAEEIAIATSRGWNVI